jgi:aspartate kinase
MIVSKFGGTSVGSYEAMSRSANIIVDNPKRSWVVISATSGTTNDLLRLCSLPINSDEGNGLLEQISRRHLDIASQCSFKKEAIKAVEECMHNLSAHLSKQKSSKQQTSNNSSETEWIDSLLAFGEHLSTQLFAWVLREKNLDVQLEWAGNFICTDSRFGSAAVDLEATYAKVQHFLTANEGFGSDLKPGNVLLTQGFIGADVQGRTTTLGRGGSDYSAALFAEALEAECLEIWTDVAGVYTTDPRVVSTAHAIDEISFDEAAELSIFGGKVLHPAMVKPVRRANIPVRVASSMEPELPGTNIVTNPLNRPVVRTLSVRKEQTLMTLHSLEMLHQPGFLAKVFSILSEHSISVDLVTTSEVSVSLTLDTAHKASNKVELSEAVLRALNDFCDVEVEYNLALVAVIGNALNQTLGISGQLFSTLKDYNIRLISHGASANNVCFLVDESDAEAVVQTLHQSFIG